jgi:hypothetical protein
MVSQRTRRDVNTTWRNYRKDPPAYAAARNKAIAEVVAKEAPENQPELF